MPQTNSVPPIGEFLPQSAVGETRYLLDRWRLSIASDGRCWATPVQLRTTPEELAAFLALFQQCWDASFPVTLIFDFSGVKVLGEQWSLLFELLYDFAGSRGAKCRVFSFRRGPGKVVVISRAGQSFQRRTVRERRGEERAKNHIYLVTGSGRDTRVPREILTSRALTAS